MNEQRIHKLTSSRFDGGVGLCVDGAPEGIHIEWEILPDVLAAIVHQAAQASRADTTTE